MVDIESRPAPAARADDGHVDRRVLGRRQQVPDRRGGTVAHHRAVAAGEHRGHLARQRHERQVADRVHATVEAVKPVASQPRIDRARPYPHRQQLRPRHDAVLPGRQLRDQPVLRHPVDLRHRVDNSHFEPL